MPPPSHVEGEVRLANEQRDNQETDCADELTSNRMAILGELDDRYAGAAALYVLVCEGEHSGRDA